MVEVLGTKSTAFASKAKDALNDTNVQTSLIGAAIAGATTFMLSGAVTKQRIMAVFDDIVDMSLFTPLSSAISAAIPNAAVQGTMVTSTLLAGLGIGEKITDMVMAADLFETNEKGEEVLRGDAKMKVALLAGAVAGLCVYITPYIKDAIEGKLKLPDLAAGNYLNNADNVTSLLIKFCGIYLISGIAYAIFGRYSLADANADKKCTEAEYEAWLNELDGIGAIFKPVITFVKPFMGVIGFDHE
jgi:hypothetical protein